MNRFLNGAGTNRWLGTANGVNLAYAYAAQNRLTNVLVNRQAAACKCFSFESFRNLTILLASDVFCFCHHLYAQAA